MSDKDLLIIQKLIGYAQDISQFSSNFEFTNFMEDKKTVSACAFIIGQMGEIAKNISDETQKLHSEIPWKSIRGMRNRIVHDYENVDFTVMWTTIQKDIPDFEHKLSIILEDL
jgi:uncharacterized protein with HEPN domain